MITIHRTQGSNGTSAKKQSIKEGNQQRRVYQQHGKTAVDKLYRNFGQKSLTHP